MFRQMRTGTDTEIGGIESPTLNRLSHVLSDVKVSVQSHTASLGLVSECASWPCGGVCGGRCASLRIRARAAASGARRDQPFVEPSVSPLMNCFWSAK